VGERTLRLSEPSFWIFASREPREREKTEALFRVSSSVKSEFSRS
jgi:hypothetical protein